MRSENKVGRGGKKMSGTTQHSTTPAATKPPSSASEMSADTTTPYSTTSTDIIDSLKDVIMWRRKLTSLAVLGTATALWVAMEVYQFNFITIASWTTIFLLTSSFIWTNLLRLIRKKEPEMSGLEISENTAMGIANSIRRLAKEATRWMLKVGADSEWYVTAGTVASLWLLSVICSLFDLLTILYIGIVVGMTVPVIWVKYDHKIKKNGERLYTLSKRSLNMIDEKVVQKVKSKVGGAKKEVKVKVKKVE